MIPERATESSRNQFSLAVEKKAVNEKKSYLTALFEVVEECSLDPDVVPKYINESLKAKIFNECVENRIIRTTPRNINISELLV